MDLLGTRAVQLKQVQTASFLQLLCSKHAIVPKASPLSTGLWQSCIPFWTTYVGKFSICFTLMLRGQMLIASEGYLWEKGIHHTGRPYWETILGGLFSLPQRANNEKKGFSQSHKWIRQRAFVACFPPFYLQRGHQRQALQVNKSFFSMGPV